MFLMKMQRSSKHGFLKMIAKLEKSLSMAFIHYL